MITARKALEKVIDRFEELAENRKIEIDRTRCLMDESEVGLFHVTDVNGFNIDVIRRRRELVQEKALINTLILNVYDIMEEIEKDERDENL